MALWCEQSGVTSARKKWKGEREYMIVFRRRVDSLTFVVVGLTSLEYDEIYPV